MSVLVPTADNGDMLTFPETADDLPNIGVVYQVRS